MPTYEYACVKCGHQYEKRESFDAPARQRCPRCRGASQRMLFAPPIVFKGSGFYVTDSRKGSSSDGAGETKSEPTKADPKEQAPSSSGSETKEKAPLSSSSETEAAAAG